MTRRTYGQHEGHSDYVHILKGTFTVSRGIKVEEPTGCNRSYLKDINDDEGVLVNDKSRFAKKPHKK